MLPLFRSYDNLNAEVNGIMITITTTIIISSRAVVEYIFDIRNLSPLKAMTIIINSPSTDVTELTSETLQAEGYEIDMEEC